MKQYNQQYTEYMNHIEDSYDEYISYLIKKYGPVKGNYFVNENCKSKNRKILRTNEGLNIHHIDENKCILLAEPIIAKSESFEYQKANRLVYANLLEHILLHIKISEETQSDESEEPTNLGTGGVILIVRQVNDYFANLPQEPSGWRKNMFDAIRDSYDEYIKILKYILNSKCKGLNYTIKELSSGWDKNPHNKILKELEN